MMKLKKSMYLNLFFLAGLLFSCPSFSSEEPNFIKPDWERDRQAIEDFKKARGIGENSPINVLAIDGGGVRGVIPSEMIAKIEQIAGCRIFELVDLIVATSTGGIISLGLDTLAADDVIVMYKELAKKIFPEPGWFDSLWWTYKYSEVPLEEQLNVVFGNKELKDLSIPTVITSVDAEYNHPYYFRSYRAAWDPSQNYFVKDAARATSAAPTYFSMKEATPVNGKDSKKLVDGGVAANNPAHVALGEAYKIFGVRPVNLISLGTGTSCAVHEARDVGYIKRVFSLMEMLFDVQLSLPDQLIGGLDDALGDHLTYRRLQISLPDRLIPMDCASNVEELSSIARFCCDHEKRGELEHIADLLLGAVKMRGKGEEIPKMVRRDGVIEDNPYFYKPLQDEKITVDDVLKRLEGVKTLDLSNRGEVDDEFMRILSIDRGSESLAYINLGGTGVTEKSLEHILT